MVPSWSLMPKLMSIDHPCRMNNLTWAKSLSWNNANTVGICQNSICIKFSSTLTDPLEINRFVYFLPPTVRFDSKSHHLLYDKQPPEKKMHCRFHLYLPLSVPLSSDGGIVCDHITFDAPAKQSTNSLPDQHLMPCSEFCVNQRYSICL